MTKHITKTERIAKDRFTYHMWLMTEGLDLNEYAAREHVPDAWHSIEQDIDCEEEKVKVTLYLDKSVVRCFRAMGKGYHARINRLLQTWLQLRAAGMLETDRYLQKRMTEMDKRRAARRVANGEEE